MKYLKYFKTEEEYNTFIQSADFLLPNVTCVGDESVFYHVVATESGDYKIFLLEKKNISGLTYNMVDLGLPSGRLWADRNVGASSPEDFGTYFAWGETEGYNTSITYCTAAELCGYMQPLLGDDMELTPDNIDGVLSEMDITNKDLTITRIGFGTDKCFSTDWSDYFDTTDGGVTFNKYATNKLTVLEASDDAVTVNMGSEYRMPTLTDFNELINNCTATFIDLDGNEFSQSEAESDSIPETNFKGIKFTGPNGNSIFIIASAFCSDSMGFSYFGCGCLWSSTLHIDQDANVNTLYFNWGGMLIVAGYARVFGIVTRGVK